MSYPSDFVQNFPLTLTGKKSSLAFSVSKSKKGVERYVLGISKASATGDRPISISLRGAAGSQAVVPSGSPPEARLSIYNASSLIMGNAADSITSSNGSLELLNGSSLNLSGGSNRLSLLGLIKLIAPRKTTATGGTTYAGTFRR